ncbi:MAG: SLBB domain-containing protein [Betaproteobacteria bacterium]
MSHVTEKLHSIAECVRSAGVVGASGGGFSLADKLTARPYRTLIINAGQSEPLICKDWAALAHYSTCVLLGAQLLIEAMGLNKVFLAVREEFHPLLPELPAAVRKYGVILARLPDIYPLGYEKILKRELLGIPMNATGNDDIIVINAETLRNLSWAVNRKRPVTTKLITLGGAVTHPISLEVPVGIPFRDCLHQAGGANCADYTVFQNGVLAGHPVDPDQSWVSATTLGYVLLPATHSVISSQQQNDAMNVRLVQRRADFLESTVAGRTQAMSAAYSLFDLSAYRRSRPVFNPPVPNDSDKSLCVRITAGGRTRELQPCVAVGDKVVRGQAVARLADSTALPLHASIDGTVEQIDITGIRIRHADARGAFA